MTDAPLTSRIIINEGQDWDADIEKGYLMVLDALCQGEFTEAASDALEILDCLEQRDFEGVRRIAKKGTPGLAVHFGSECVSPNKDASTRH